MRAAILLLAAFGCGNAKKDAYAEIAHQVNATLVTAQPTAKRIIGLGAADHVAVIEACKSSDDALWVLRNTKFEGDEIVLPHDRFPVSHYAAYLLDDRPLMCRSSGSIALERCSRFCREGWLALIAAVEALREDARRVGVEIVSLQ